MMMIVIRLIVFGAHKEKLVAALSPGCLNMRCLPKKFYALTLVGGGQAQTQSSTSSFLLSPPHFATFTLVL